MRAARGAPGTARATQEFSAYSKGNPEAAEALTRWFREESTEPYVSTYVLVDESRIAAFVALQSSSVAISPKNAKRLRFPDSTRIPATLITHMARHQDSCPGTGTDALLFAASIAQRANQLQRTAVLVVDPFDVDTAEMWRSRFRFEQSLEDGHGGHRRLYMPMSRAKL